MGYVKHHTIVVTGFIPEQVAAAHQKAKEIFERHFTDDIMDAPLATRIISGIIEGITNGQSSFFIAPDGSKEGWATSDNADNARKEFLDYLKKTNSCDYIEIIFGGDSDQDEITRSRVKDYEEV